jgi:hypothetical protein
MGAILAGIALTTTAAIVAVAAIIVLFIIVIYQAIKIRKLKKEPYYIHQRIPSASMISADVTNTNDMENST